MFQLGKKKRIEICRGLAKTCWRTGCGLDTGCRNSSCVKDEFIGKLNLGE
jgi:hypothetical protein